jgi:hypothetical protein
MARPGIETGRCTLLKTRAGPVPTRRSRQKTLAAESNPEPLQVRKLSRRDNRLLEIRVWPSVVTWPGQKPTGIMISQARFFKA